MRTIEYADREVRVGMQLLVNGCNTVRLIAGGAFGAFVTAMSDRCISS